MTFEESEGIPGVLKLSSLQAAVERPKVTFDGEDLYATLASKAAALTESLIQNHPFLAANKRTGIISGVLFLIRNGQQTIAEEGELSRVALSLATHEMSFDDLVEWFESETAFLPLTPEELDELEERDFWADQISDLMEGIR